MLRAFTLDNLRWLCRSCHRRKTRQDRRLAKFLTSCSLDWHGAQRMLGQYRRWALAFMMPRSWSLHRDSAARVDVSQKMYCFVFTSCFKNLVQCANGNRRGSRLV